ncbi:TIGR04283 family arsenosugar biosynthesis glycosyltransferase [Spirulina sp. 06S082]|uniref:TIGR04283 family arsenosugar biosynthesis glycosyltransferase n=1 Tax=Spirulina sp. 06S082 TaxID=3110248 RepID=UPI002B1EB4BD|nr:TIGR04283 family arsenosugar biosynthesis glycosyltransferase [Spirulina sp. 06S082]MEA5468953.1 TIGR04283 family arsenosugar biosynthesis glycosyltransferase [Spirulina sp. 06S082]
MISIIIPVLNEAKTIQTTLLTLEKSPSLEIIVVDGGSEDDTLKLAQEWGAITISSPQTGRAKQMNTGAAIASGEILLFLHADTHLPRGYAKMVQDTLGRSQAIAGAFELKIAGEMRALRWVERMVNLRSHYCSLPYGDQSLFLKATTFQDLGGFPDIPLMEDFEFVRQLRKAGRIYIVPHPVLTSGRRWQKLGVLKTTAINQVIILGYFLGVSPYRLAQWYRTFQ